MSEITQAKIKSLISGFSEFGFKTSHSIGQKELTIFLDKRSSSGKFDDKLSEKLYKILNLEGSSKISINEFINGYIQFEEELRKNAELFGVKFMQEKKIYEQIYKSCKKYQTEKLNAEGFCENAKISGEVTDIDIKKKLEGIKEIIIIVIYNEKKVEIRFKIGDNEDNAIQNRSFEFKPKSRKDHFEFVMKGVNDKNNIFDIGSRVFPLDSITSQEEYLVQIIIPELENSEQIAAYIKTKIVLYWSDFHYYESQRKKQEKRMNKFSKAYNQALEYLKMVREIYGDLSQMKPDLTVDFNNERLMERKGAQLNVNFNNMMGAEASGGNYLVEFNNERQIQKTTPLRVEFNNTKQIQTPIIQKYEYTYKKNIVNNVEKSTKSNIEQNVHIDNNINENPNIEKTIITKKEQQVQSQTVHVPETSQNQSSNVQEEIHNSNQGEGMTILTPPTNNVSNNSEVVKIVKTEKKIVSTTNEDQNLNQNTQDQNILFSFGPELSDKEVNLNEFIKNSNMNQHIIGTTTQMTSNISNEQNIQQDLGSIQTSGNFGMIETSGQEINQQQIGINSTVLKPIIHKDNVVYSVKQSIVNQNVNKPVVSENTLPVSYLPAQINSPIVDHNVQTLPLITDPQPNISYEQYHGNETNYMNNINNYNINNQGEFINNEYQGVMDSNNINNQNFSLGENNMIMNNYSFDNFISQNGNSDNDIPVYNPNAMSQQVERIENNPYMNVLSQSSPIIGVN